MGFQHPHQQQHKLNGMAKAARSPNTPAHLREHLEKRAGTSMANVNNLRKPTGKIPQQNILRSTAPADVAERPPMDTEDFTTIGNSIVPTRVGSSTQQPAPAGTRPMNVTASLPKRTGAGIVQAQGAVRSARPAAAGLAQNLGRVNRPNESRRVPKVGSVVVKGQRGPGIQQTASMQKTRHMRGVSANPNFYGDFT